MKKNVSILLLGGFVLWGASASAANRVVVIPLSKSAVATSKTIFVTNGSWTGNLGGLSGADSKCNAEAKARGIAGKYQALLGSPEGTPQHRSIHYPVPYVTETGTYLNSDYHDLFAGGVDNPVGSSSWGVWTGLDASEAYVVNGNCASWADGTGGNVGFIGISSSIGTAWYTNAVGVACNNSMHLYCIEQ